MVSTFGVLILNLALVAGIPMDLVMMNNEVTNGAVCLDGTAAGFYYSRSTNTANSNDWQIYFTGGGWCYDEQDCYGRSFSGLGSSTNWAKTSSIGGMLSDNCATNPDFCNYNRVQLAYCDGNSFSGDRTDPVVVNGKPLYFRGRRILDAVIRTLLTQNFGLGNAANILLTGCSAGGLAAYLHADYVYSLVQSFPSLVRYKVAPISGFFLLQNNIAGIPVYPTEMQSIFNLANSTNGLNTNCIAAKAPADQWQCNFAQESYAYTTVPIFALNSAFDAWQSGCIFTADLPNGFPNQTNPKVNGNCTAVSGWSECLQNLNFCSPDQVYYVNGYIFSFTTTMTSIPTYSKAGNGAFIHSCVTHCEAQSDPAFNTFAVNGVTMRKALGTWWNSATSTPAFNNSYRPCTYQVADPPRQCNPTCGTQEREIQVVDL